MIDPSPQAEPNDADRALAYKLFGLIVHDSQLEAIADYRAAIVFKCVDVAASWLHDINIDDEDLSPEGTEETALDLRREIIRQGVEAWTK